MGRAEGRGIHEGRGIYDSRVLEETLRVQCLRGPCTQKESAQECETEHSEMTNSGDGGSEKPICS